MASIVVRRAEPSDLTPIRDLVEAARRNGESWAHSWDRQLLDDELAKAEVFIARSGVAGSGRADDFAGFMCIRPPGFAFEITLIAVSSAFRGNGVSRLLIERGAETGPISLEVRSDNLSAIRAYEKSGFKAVGRRKAYYRDGCDAILYTRA